MNKFFGDDKTRMYKQIFQKAGLTPTQAEILEYLYIQKEDKASTIAQKIKKSRAIVYKDIEEMINLGIIEKIDKPNQATIFRIGHPAQMEKFFDKKEKEVKKDRELFNNYLPDMISSYNSLHSKPGVKYYEGLGGQIKALENAGSKLLPNTEIISFTKVLEERQAISELDEALVAFVKKRIRKNIKTRVIALDTPEAQKLKSADQSNLRETRLAIKTELPFDFPGGEIFIYGNEIYSVSLENGNFFALIIENKSIAYLLKALFESAWTLLPSSSKWE